MAADEHNKGRQRATGTAKLKSRGGSQQVAVREVSVGPELGGMSQYQLNAINLGASRGIPSVGLPHLPMELGEYCDRMHNNGTGYPVLTGFKTHMLRLLDSVSDELRRDQWDALFTKYSCSDNSPEHPMPTADDLQWLRDNTPVEGEPVAEGGSETEQPE